MRNTKRIIAALIVLLFSITIVGCGSKTVATVNGEKITKKELDKRMKKVKMSMESQGVSFNGQQGQLMLQALEKQTLDEMITQALVIQAAKKEGVNPSEADVKKAIDEIIASFGGEKQFNEALKSYGYTMAEIKEMKTFDLAQSNLFNKVTADVKVTDEDIKKWYDDNKANYKDPAQIKAKAILIKFDDPSQKDATGQPLPQVGRSEADAKKLAEDIIKELGNGADFAKLAKEKSDDEYTKGNGGQIKDPNGKDTFAKGTGILPPEVEEAVVALKEGSYTKTPVKSSIGYYIIKLESLTPEKQLTFEEAKPRIQQELPATRKQQKFNEYLTDLRNKAKITNTLESATPKQPAASSGQELPPGHPPTDGSQSAPAK